MRRSLASTSLRDVILPRVGSLLESAKAYKSLVVDVDDGVALVTLDRPAKHNALNMQLWEEIPNCFEACSRDPEVRCVILRGSGGNFCAGMDLGIFAEMQAIAAEEGCEGRRSEQLLKTIQYFQDGISSPEKCSKPVLAAMAGNVIGGGVDLATACDLRYCTDSVRISVKEVDLGIVADIGTMQRLPHLVGDQRARELTYTGRFVGGREAKDIGLVLDSFVSEEEMDVQVMKVAQQIASKSPLTIRGIKAVSLYTRDHPTEDALNHVAQWKDRKSVV